ncbi:NAD(P)/FAD-dependent oxidoreductase [Clostridium beijerinckii]|jgi:nitrite reductase (NADH) large subunit|uniref:Nitrite reductase (NADH) large subunit n=1 Tax=Clostridium beijerinckii TaxID=1520 RepID=A0AAX0AVI2_CLOBE|nr:FAD-dependent oxidoreductase [Clostridium beijerinckii]MBA8934515.1 nitrite reductase (NADH) large subunit [Clostridium beijerinckii]MCI1578698.1 FAD-dependent oxidoreductase [Clostridium beijerinckii]NRT87060.1 nitrite reductase (NADH) large subunit [Clostridium beijerinckii]
MNKKEVFFLEEKIVIIGSGIAAISAAKAIREIDKQSEIVIFGEEKFYPYYRIKISKGLLGNLEEDKLLIQKKKWYTDNNIQVYSDNKVTGVDTKNKEAILENGTRVPYTKLLLANGASNLTPPIKGIDKPGVFNLRTLDGALKILEYLNNVKRVLLIGGGVQNLEIANILSECGKKVIIAEFASRLMPRQLDEFASDKLKKSIEAQNIEVMLDTQVQEIFGEEKVKGFITKSGAQGACDMVIYSTGIMPNVSIAQNTDLEVNKGIVVNNKMQTNMKDIFAAGDVSEFNGRVYGLWSMAMQQGKVAGANICNQDLIFEHSAPVTSLSAFGISVFSMGYIEGDQDIDLLVEGSDNEHKYYKILISNNHIVGTIVLGDNKKFMVIKSLIENKIEVNINEAAKYSIDEFIEIISNKKGN